MDRNRPLTICAHISVTFWPSDHASRSPRTPLRETHLHRHHPPLSPGMLPITGLTVRGTKRKEPAEGDAAPMETGALGSRDSQGAVPTSSSSAQGAMGNLPATVGTGEFEQPLMEAVLQGFRDMALDLEGVKGALYDSWEIPPGSTYVEEGLVMKEQWNKDCREKKGPTSETSRTM